MVADQTAMETRAAYQGLAGNYASINREMPESLAVLGREMLSYLPMQPQLLDLGCGSGRDMEWFESQKANVTGVDLSPAMLAEARPFVHGPLLEMEARKLTFTDGVFDAVWSAGVLHHLPKESLPAALAEISRVLRPGGYVFATLKEGTTEAWEADSFYEGERFFARYRAEELERQFRGAGLEPLRPVWHDQGREEVWLQGVFRKSN